MVVESQIEPKRSDRGTGASVFPRKNNLEWLRLLFAIQVVLGHMASHMGLYLPKIIASFPGVPAFFFVSGFLIYSSWLNSPGRRYAENRFLRLFPALLFATVGSCIVTLIAHGWRTIFQHPGTYVVWFLAQLTLGQAYNPRLFRDIGVGVLNGSLWTITCEVLFYLSVPLIAWLERRLRFVLPLLFLTSFTIYAVGPTVWGPTVYRGRNVYSFLALTPIVWGWMFAIGILAARNFARIQVWIKFAPGLVLLMIPMILRGRGPFFNGSGNELGLFYYVCYVGLVVWFAFHLPYVRLSFDLSYGSYIWHMPVINFLLVTGLHSVPLGIVTTFAIATLSWFLVEKPALRRKRKTLKPV
jgi:peptidoglycan/LPS O-acetylase OafA/YrhL